MAYAYIGEQKVSPMIVRADYDIVTVSGTSATISLTNNTIYNAEILTSLTINAPYPVPTDFIAQVNFDSGSTATALSASNTIEWFGDNVSETVGFVPRANCSYSIMFYCSGSGLRGVIQGSTLVQGN